MQSEKKEKKEKEKNRKIPSQMRNIICVSAQMDASVLREEMCVCVCFNVDFLKWRDTLGCNVMVPCSLLYH